MNPFGKVFGIIIGVLGMVGVIALFYTSEQEKLAQSMVESITNEFVKEVGNDGYISEEMWVRLFSKLDATGLSFDIEIEHNHRATYPKEDPYGHTVPGSFVVIEEKFYTDDIVGKLSADGVYKMTRGDSIRVSITCTRLTQASLLRRSLFGNLSDAGLICATADGAIRDEAY